ncbi:Ig-like domain-containing protein [Ferruginibacter sp. HRS2-29]|uniref:Ig-like domain-containing protein n=1 Tax=Ferruginibacter sp. HRS2-29 TaxID=2487334 RepID=UPI0020CCBBB8|nr:Ig-like domain-containing protein [Ferruginibacter sp. HRS2-29]MCP9750163.1 hypothetical protein [Ferruginibacter sp. HRS2-29]
MKHKLIVFIAIALSLYSLSVTNSGCAQIGMPTGGLKDSLAPVLVRASPDNKATNAQEKKISLTFNEYVEVEDPFKNVIVTPVPKGNPEIRFNLKTVTVRLKDSLLPNTTYSINFGNSIKDVNEGNIYRDFTYVFSTGDKIDSLQLRGKVVLAETGKTDSTLLVLLYRNAVDSSVATRRPDYIARVTPEGTFNFKYLPQGNFRVYALKDGDGNKSYNSKTEMFGFLPGDKEITVADSSANVLLYAYEQEKPKPVGATGAAPKPKLEKKLRYSGQPAKQDLLTPLTITFNNPVTVDQQKIYLTDTNYNRIAGVKFSLDSTDTKISLAANWKPETDYVLFVDKDIAKDSLGNTLAKSDTIRFATKKNEDYGRIVIRFTNLDLSKNPVLQFLEGEEVKYSYPITSPEWSNQLFPPGDYGIRILLDDNKNGKWDPGDFSKKLQPETSILLPQKLGIKANWDNEREIKL